MSENKSGTEEGQLAFPLEQNLVDFARQFATDLKVPLVIWLEGDLGAGKTTFARGLIQALGYTGRVKSPTYGLLEQYQLDTVQILHMDLYRIAEAGELEFLGLADLMDKQTVLLIEWPDKGGRWIPEADFVFKFGYVAEGRDLHWSARTSVARNIKVST
jgi:tRNA threonylcarbamoyladenosine biosynthesis protein TsaE